MGLGKYILGSLVLIIAVAAYAHFGLALGDYRIEIYGTVILLPIAAWVVLPTTILFIATVLHLIYYGFKGYLYRRSIHKDEENMLRLLKDKIENKNTQYGFKNTEFENIATVVKQSNICVAVEDFETNSKPIKETVEKIQKINAGEYLTTKEYKIEANPELEEKNILNHVQNSDDFYLDVLKKNSEYSSAVVKKSFEKLIENKTITTIKKYMNDLPLDNSMITSIFQKDAQKQEEFSLSDEEIIQLISKSTYGEYEYMELAKIYKTSMLPDRIIKLFEKLSSNNEEATSAYLYVLFEFEMVDEIRDILASTSKEEFVPFKALLDLKDSGKHYTLESISYK